jgi:hypothetical protein
MAETTTHTEEVVTQSMVKTMLKLTQKKTQSVVNDAETHTEEVVTQSMVNDVETHTEEVVTQFVVSLWSTMLKQQHNLLH